MTVDDETTPRERVALAHEGVETYDAPSEPSRSYCHPPVGIERRFDGNPRTLGKLARLSSSKLTVGDHDDRGVIPYVLCDRTRTPAVGLYFRPRYANTMTDDPLFEQFELNGHTLDNRVGLAPMTRTSATDAGHATDRMARYYASFARGGFSFLITEGIYPDTTHSQGYLNQPGLATDEQATAWEQVVDAVHEEGSPVFAQLMHAGAQAQGNRYGYDPVAPSSYRPPGDMSELYGGSGEFPEADPLDAEELTDVRESFVAAAERAVNAGFDGIEVHAANGYLLHEFVDPLVNDRDDEYGGSPANRARFPAEVTATIDDATPDSFVVGVRTSQAAVTDEERVWPDGEVTAAALFGALSDAGADYIHVTGGDATASEVPDTDRTLVGLAVEHVGDDVAVIANGGLGDPETARAALADGSDLVTIGTGALANHDWPDRVRTDEPLDDLDPSIVFEPDASLSDAEIPGDD